MELSSYCCFSRSIFILKRLLLLAVNCDRLVEVSEIVCTLQAADLCLVLEEERILIICLMLYCWPDKSRTTLTFDSLWDNSLGEKAKRERERERCYCLRSADVCAN